MTRYIFRRLIGVVAILVVISILTFGIFFLIPADPALKSCGKGCNLPVFPVGWDSWHPTVHATSQYSVFVKGIFVGRDFVGGGSDKRCDAPCLGFSFLTDQPVWTDLIDRVPVTFSSWTMG